MPLRRPVTFHYKKEIGLVAEEVEKVNSSLVARDGHGKISTVRYDGGDAMLLNEFLKHHRKVQEQETAITKLKSVVVKQ